MIKSLLVILDGSKASESAKKLAVQMAKLHKASLTGLGVLDEPWIVAPEAIPLGGAAFKADLDERVLEDIKRRVHDLEKQFMDYCKSQKTQASIIDTTGIPAEEIEHFSSEFDIIIMGKDANFHFSPSQEATESIKQILKDSPRPILITSPHLPNQESPHVLIAFDGTFSAGRALHMAILLGMLKGKTIHIASVSENEKQARYHVNLAAKLCHNHGLDVHLHPLVSAQKPSLVLLNLLQDLKPSLVVMGAYGHGGIHAFFMGSCSRDLLKETDIPLFMFR